MLNILIHTSLQVYTSSFRIVPQIVEVYTGYTRFGTTHPCHPFKTNYITFVFMYLSILLDNRCQHLMVSSIIFLDLGFIFILLWLNLLAWNLLFYLSVNSYPLRHSLYVQFSILTWFCA